MNTHLRPIAPLIEQIIGEIKDHTENKASFGPYIIGIAGSVCSGKTTLARLLQGYLLEALGLEQTQIGILGTDNFLRNYADLSRNRLIEKKGHPESYDYAGIQLFFEDLLSGQCERIKVPRYDHDLYDTHPSDMIEFHPKQLVVLIIEGVNVLQPDHYLKPFALDTATQPGFRTHLNSSIYLDASEEDLIDWYKQRFIQQMSQPARQQHPRFKQYAGLSKECLEEKALSLWYRVNQPNLVQHILPFKPDADHLIDQSNNHQMSENSTGGRSPT